MLADSPTGVRRGRLMGRALIATWLGALLFPSLLMATGPVANVPQVEIKKLTTGKEATITYGDKEWFIHIDVDDNRTMIIRTESNKGQEIKNTPEIIERPMSNAEVDGIINDFVSGVKSTLNP